jgi:hypothetical protein
VLRALVWTAARVVGRRTAWLIAALVGAAAVVAGSAGDARAASLPNPISPVTNLIGGGVAHAAVGAFDAIIHHLFAPVARFINVQLVGWLVAVPDFSRGNVRQLETTVCAMSAAALGAVATIAVARYWLAGLAGGGANGFEALEGLARTIGAALFIVLWPWVFDTGVGLANLFTSGLMGAGSVTDDTARLLAVGLGAAGALSATVIGPFLMLVMAVLASVLLLGLLLVKLVLSISTVMVFVAMPAAAVLWPIPACAWLARLTARAFAVCLLVPACWALCFAATAAVGTDALGFTGSAHGVLNALIEPLVAIVLLFVTLTLPRSLAQVAMLGGSALSGGTVSRAVGYAAGRSLAGAAAQHLPAWAGGNTAGKAGGAPAAQARGSQGQASAAAAPVALGGGAAAATVTGARAASTGAASGAGADANAATPTGGPLASPGSAPVGAPQQSAAPSGANGLQSPSFHGREHHHALELLAAESRETNNPVSRGEAVQALGSLPDNTRRGVAGLVREHGAGAREHLAYQALGDWTPQQHEALRTLAAASPDVRARAVTDVLGPATPGPHGPGGNIEQPPAPESVLIDDTPRRPTGEDGAHTVERPAAGRSGPGDPPDSGSGR